MENIHKTLFRFIFIFASLTCSTPSFALLSSFEVADGYGLITSVIGDEVSYYKAGVPSGGGPSPAPTITPNSGLWKITSSAGGFYSNSADRSALNSSLIAIYAVGNHSGGRTGNALALRNDSNGPGPMTEEYSLDALDFGGVSPNSSTITNVLMGFYFCPNPSGGSSSSGSAEKFIMSLMDSTNNVGLELGYDYNNNVFWRDAAGTHYPSIVADALAYDGFSVNIDLITDTFSLNYFDASANSTNALASSGTSLLTGMTNFTKIRWSLNDGGNNQGLGGKNFFDDFSFKVTSVAEPSVLELMLVLAFAMIGLRLKSNPI